MSATMEARKPIRKRIYVAYRGDEYIGEGTLKELVKITGLKYATLYWCTTPTARKRQAEHAIKPGRPRVELMEVEDDDE